VLLACGTALAFDRMCERSGLLPPNFRIGAEMTAVERRRPALLRTTALVMMAAVFWIGVFASLGALQGTPAPPPESLAIPQLFSLHFIFVVALVLWYLLGYAGNGPSEANSWSTQLGLRATSVGREIGIGVAAGIAGWLGVILTLLAVAGVLYMLGGERAVPDQPPEVIGLVIALPILVRLMLSLSAGVVEELFFRGLLQPRIGVLASSTLFVMAHLSYAQPFLLIGVGLLSVLFSALVIWRQNIWAAVSAHAVFDAIQLLIVIPSAMRFLEEAEAGPVALALSWILAIG
jgi:membrane protease YdiL (CAAX protease family)